MLEDTTVNLKMEMICKYGFCHKTNLIKVYADIIDSLRISENA